MMSSNATVKIPLDFLAGKRIFQEIGFELTDTKYINEDKYFIVKKIYFFYNF